MVKAIDDLVDRYDRGAIGRRELVKGLLMAAAAPLAALGGEGTAAAQAPASPILRVRNINHVHFDVSDLQRSYDFYHDLFGATIKAKSPTFWTLNLPTGIPGQAQWFSINKAPLPKPSSDGAGVKPGVYAHMGIGIDIPDPQATKRFSDIINAKYPFAKATPTGPWNEKGEFNGARSIYMRDPDGLIFQLIRPGDDGYLTQAMMKPA